MRYQLVYDVYYGVSGVVLKEHEIVSKISVGDSDEQEATVICDSVEWGNEEALVAREHDETKKRKKMTKISFSSLTNSHE